MRRKTTIYLDADLDGDLERMARERRISKAELIRSALRRMFEGYQRPSVMAIGVGRGPGDVAGDVDRHLRETKFGE